MGVEGLHGPIPDEEVEKMVVAAREQIGQVLADHPELGEEEHPVLICRLYDSGGLLMGAGRALVPFRASQNDGEARDLEHFQALADREFRQTNARVVDELYHSLPFSDEDESEFVRAYGALLDQRIAILKRACEAAAVEIPVVAFVQNETMWRERAIRIGGKGLPALPAPVSAYDLYSRLERMEESGFCGDESEDGRILGFSAAGWHEAGTLETFVETEEVAELCQDLEYVEVRADQVEAFRAALKPVLPGVEVRVFGMKRHDEEAVVRPREGKAVGGFWARVKECLRGRR